MCCEAEGVVASTQWQFVGEGNGSFSNVPTYNYVGEGCGSFDKQVITTGYGWKFRACCLPLTGLLLLGGLGLLLIPGITTDTTTPLVIVTPAPTSAPEIITTTAMNCETRELWSLAKKAYCCKVYGVGCSTTPAQTTAVVTVAPTFDPVTTSSCPFDCNAGYDEWPMQWVKGWGGAKKLYCCKTVGRGCPSELPPPSGIPASGLPPAPDVGPYDCNAGYHPCYTCLVKHWSANKLSWCCTKKNIGCRANTPDHM